MTKFYTLFSYFANLDSFVTLCCF